MLETHMRRIVYLFPISAMLLACGQDSAFNTLRPDNDIDEDTDTAQDNDPEPDDEITCNAQDLSFAIHWEDASGPCKLGEKGYPVCELDTTEMVLDILSHCEKDFSIETATACIFTAADVQGFSAADPMIEIAFGPVTGVGCLETGPTKHEFISGENITQRYELDYMIVGQWQLQVRLALAMATIETFVELVE